MGCISVCFQTRDSPINLVLPHLCVWSSLLPVYSSNSLQQKVFSGWCRQMVDESSKMKKTKKVFIEEDLRSHKEPDSAFLLGEASVGVVTTDETAVFWNKTVLLLSSALMMQLQWHWNVWLKATGGGQRAASSPHPEGSADAFLWKCYGHVQPRGGPRTR